VSGVRRDVTVVCLALAQTSWYMRQLRDNPLREFDVSSAPKPWNAAQATKPDWPLHTMTDEEITSAAETPILLEQATAVPFGPITHTYPAKSVFYPNDIVALRIIQQNIGRRQIVWGITAGRDFAGLADYVVQQGLTFRLETAKPDTTRPGLIGGGVGGRPVDLPLTEQLLWQTYRYGALLSPENDGRLESTSASIASTLSIPFTLVAYHHDQRGDSAAVLKNLERAQQLAPSAALESALKGYRGGTGGFGR
jgi:hypothetical protein